MRRSDLTEKLQRFCQVWELESIQRLYAQKLNCEENIAHCVASYEIGKKYVRIVQGDERTQRMVRYFVRIEDGAIFASATWRKPNFHRQFGTLDTIDQFTWGDYEGVAKVGAPFKMVRTAGPYFTAVPA